MKFLFYPLIALLLLSGCSGKDGEPGPKGDTGEKGATGAQGPKGDKGEPGDEASQAYTYDFTLDVTEYLANYKFEIPLDSQEFVMVFIKSGELYKSMPLNGYAFDISKKLHRVNFTYDYGGPLLFINNDTVLPDGATFSFRAVVIKGTPGKRLNMERYKDYANVKADFGLKD